KREAVPISLISFRQWREYHQKPLTKNRPEFLLNNDGEIDIFDVTLTKEGEMSVLELKNALKIMEIGRAPGPSGILVKLLLDHN
ncbi:hypothetical protein ILUMI_19957, partial [Ignelater luminosus]